MTPKLNIVKWAYLLTFYKYFKEFGSNERIGSFFKINELKEECVWIFPCGSDCARGDCSPYSRGWMSCTSKALSPLWLHMKAGWFPSKPRSPFCRGVTAAEATLFLMRQVEKNCIWMLFCSCSYMMFPHSFFMRTTSPAFLLCMWEAWKTKKLNLAHR